MCAKLLVLAFAMAAAGQKLSAQPARTQFDPNDPSKTRPVIKAAEREQLGLKSKDWDGVLHPDVLPTLAKLTEDLAQARTTNTVDAIDTLFKVQFNETVYVQVLLKQDTAGGAYSVLEVLTAAEFHALRIFEKHPGLLGYASRTALDKFANHPDVLGVTLDDQPLPEPMPVVYGNRLPKADLTKYAHEAGIKAGKVDPKVYQALEMAENGQAFADGLRVEAHMVNLTPSERGWVFVMVALEPKDGPLPELTHVQQEKHQRWLERDRAIRKLQDRVLSQVAANEFMLWTRLGGATGFAGYVNRTGLEKLMGLPEVTKVGLSELEGLGSARP